MKLTMTGIATALALLLMVSSGPAVQPAPGDLGPPADFMVTQNADSIFFSWLPVEGADKYTVETCGMITWGDGSIRGEVPLKMGICTKDEIGMVYMRSGRVVLEIPKATLARIVLAELQDAGVDRASVIGFLLEATSKVKALDPGKGKGPQNNPWSNTDDWECLWTRS